VLYKSTFYLLTYCALYNKNKQGSFVTEVLSGALAESKKLVVGLWTSTSHHTPSTCTVSTSHLLYFLRHCLTHKKTGTLITQSNTQLAQFYTAEQALLSNFISQQFSNLLYFVRCSFGQSHSHVVNGITTTFYKSKHRQ